MCKCVDISRVLIMHKYENVFNCGCECDCNCVEPSDCQCIVTVQTEKPNTGPQHCFTRAPSPTKLNLDKFRQINSPQLNCMQGVILTIRLIFALNLSSIFFCSIFSLNGASRRMLLTLESSVKCRNVSVILTPAASNVK